MMRNVHVQTSVGVVALRGEDAAFRKSATVLIHGACGSVAGGHMIGKRRRPECLQIIREVTALQAQ